MGMFRKFKLKMCALILPSIIGGTTLFFAINLIASAMKPYIRELIKNVDMATPVNPTIVVMIPFGILGGLLVSLIFRRMLKKERYLGFAVGASAVGFCIDTFVKTGGLLGFLLLLDDSPNYLLFVFSAFLLEYGTAFIAMLYSLKGLNALFSRKPVIR